MISPVQVLKIGVVRSLAGLALLRAWEPEAAKANIVPSNI